ncbi:DUF202 domain-containing protein [Streptococcus oriscaviae]|uniref:DUF202 domain-containing protein n=1 Tax=Streptococcus oriscaviae TaxID=2781599 RepID=A0ABX7YI38_9STRE|nr:DUF202 domain-containing protein [Streptococcus oriscaviae]QUE53452.1 DUF202 domain-containing protein [Streptococcus oriscaviae]
MTQDELVRGYEAEISYQKHMIDNLGRWLTLMFLLASIGGLLIYYFKESNIPLFILGLALAILGGLAVLLFGYGIYKGRLNLMKVIKDFDDKVAKSG